MATIIQRGDKWRVQVRLKGVSKSATFTRHTDAKAWAARVETEIMDGVRGNASRHRTFLSLIDRYDREVTPTKRGQRQERIRLNCLRRIPIAKMQVDDIRPQDFADYRDMRLQSVKSSTVNRELATLSAICEKAMREWGLMRENPVKKISKPKNPKERSRRPTQQEIDDICAALLYNAGSPPRLAMQRVAAAFLFAIETAMRAGEICGLTWDNIDFTRRLAHLPMTKNGHSRDVPLSRRAIEILNNLRDIHPTQVFNLTSQTLDVMFRRARDKCGIQDLHFHDTRREALTRMSKKVPVETLAKISGHRDLSILLNVYYRPDMAEIADMLD